MVKGWWGAMVRELGQVEERWGSAMGSVTVAAKGVERNLFQQGSLS